MNPRRLLSLVLLLGGPALAALELTDVATRGNPNGVTVTFSAPVTENTATNPANYALTPGVKVNSVTLIEAAKVWLRTSPIAERHVYSLTTNGITDTASAPVASCPRPLTKPPPPAFCRGFKSTNASGAHAFMGRA